MSTFKTYRGVYKIRDIVTLTCYKF